MQRPPTSFSHPTSWCGSWHAKVEQGGSYLMSGQCVQCVQPCCMQDVWPGGSVGGQVWCTCASCMWQGRPVGGMEPVLSALTHSSAGCPTHSDSNIASFWIEWGAPFESFSSHVQNIEIRKWKCTRSFASINISLNVGGRIHKSCLRPREPEVVVLWQIDSSCEVVIAHNVQSRTMWNAPREGGVRSYGP